VKAAPEFDHASLWRIEQNLQSIANPAFRDFIRVGLEQAYQGDFNQLRLAGHYKRFPVGVEEFICGKKYLDASANVWPIVLEHIIAINSGDYTEAVLTGGIGVAKTTIAVYTTAYQTYLLSTLKNPHKLYGLDPASEIEFIFQSMNASLAKAVDYARFRTLLARSEYFRTTFRFDARLESEMRFPNNILVKPVGGNAAGAIGQNVMGGVIDELNFMAVIEKSKQTVDKGTYDQAIEIYDSLSRRRKSRFMKQGKMPGILCLVSSKRYPGQFTDKKVEEALKEQQETGKTSVYIYDKVAWDVRPEGTYGPERFKVFVGTESRKPAILKPTDDISTFTKSEVVEIPMDYLGEFERDIMGSLRDIAGVSTLARFPYIMEPESVTRCMGKVESPFNLPSVDFAATQLVIFKSKFKNPEIPRFAHVDLAITGDSAGFAVGTCTGFMKVDRGDHFETLPKIQIDAVLEIKPPKNGEILFHKIRSMIYALTKQGLNIKWVTFDSFQSTDSMQLLKQQGYTVGYTSTDTSMLPYDITKQALYDGRIEMPTHEKLRSELVSLEKDAKKGKIDHPPNGSKDVADAFASVVYGLSYRREMWARYGVQITASSLDVMTKVENNMAKRNA